MKIKDFVLVSIGALIVIFLLWCNKPVSDIMPPVVVPVQVQKDTVNQAQAEALKIIDSLKKVSSVWEREADKYKKEYGALVKLYDDVTDDYKTILESLPKDNQDVVEAKKRFKELSELSTLKDKKCGEEILSLKTSLTVKNSIIQATESLQKRLKESFDTCVAQQEKLEKYIGEIQKATKKRNQVYAGVSVMGNEFNWLNGMGINAGVINKRGGIFEAGAFVMSKQVNYSLSFKKVISFKRK